MHARKPPSLLTTGPADHPAAGARGAALLLTLGLYLIPMALSAQPAAPASRPAAAAQRAATAPVESTPRWRELSAAQRVALKPLADAWPSLSTAHKRKWIALSRNFHKMPAEEQGKLHERMGDWVGLSASERSQARFNFVAAGKLSNDDKQAKWQAYQALSDDERHKLAEQAPRRLVPPTAIAVRPAPKQRLIRVPGRADNVSMPRIAAASHQIDPNTLLPQVDRYDAEHDGAPSR